MNEFYAEGVHDADIEPDVDWDSETWEGSGETFRQQQARWDQQDAEREAQAQAAAEAEANERYGGERFAMGLTKALEAAGNPDVHVPDVARLTGLLLADRDWLREHDTLTGEPLQDAALRDAVKAFSPAQDERQGLERYLLKRGG